jgi:uncharacterized phage-associated protein
MKHPFIFDPEKAVETILYIANKVPQCTDFHRISKLMYFADKIRLEEGGRCGDSYMAIKHGPVPCKTYDILKSMRDEGLAPVIESAKLSFTVEEKNIVKPLREADLDYFSESDLECLDKVISRQKFFSEKLLPGKVNMASYPFGN